MQVVESVGEYDEVDVTGRHWHLQVEVLSRVAHAGVAVDDDPVTVETRGSQLFRALVGELVEVALHLQRVRVGHC